MPLTVNYGPLLLGHGALLYSQAHQGVLEIQTIVPPHKINCVTVCMATEAMEKVFIDLERWCFFLVKGTQSKSAPHFNACTFNHINQVNVLFLLLEAFLVAWVDG